MEYDDRSLFLMAKGGNIEAYEHLIEAYQKKIYALALKVAGDRSDASELAQEVFLKAYKSIRSAKNEKQLPALIYKTAAGVCLNDGKRVKDKASYGFEDMPI